jgi:hypothetical protein
VQVSSAERPERIRDTGLLDASDESQRVPEQFARLRRQSDSSFHLYTDLGDLQAPRANERVGDLCHGCVVHTHPRVWAEVCNKAVDFSVRRP